MTDISIIIVSYNTRELLADCLNSIKNAIGNLNVETFVVDNNSSDDTSDYIKKKFPWVIFIQNKQNIGFSRANNIALKRARGKYLLILNPDTKLLPDTLNKIYSYFDTAEKNVGVVTCRVELESGKLDRDCKRSFPSPWKSFTHFTRLSHLFPKSKLFDSYYLGYLDESKDNEIDSCVGAFMLIKSEVINKVGMFDEEFFFYGEDLDLCYRIKKAGYKIIYTPVTKIIHYKGAASGIKKHSSHITKATRDSKIRSIKESTRAMKIFYRKHQSQSHSLLVNMIVYLSINMIERFRLIKLKA